MVLLIGSVCFLPSFPVFLLYSMLLTVLSLSYIHSMYCLYLMCKEGFPFEPGVSVSAAPLPLGANFTGYVCLLVVLRRLHYIACGLYWFVLVVF